MIGVGQYIVVGDFGVGQCYGVGDVVFFGNYFGFVVVVDVGVVGDGYWYFIVFQCVEQCGVYWCVKFVCWLQFSKFQFVGGGFSYWGEEFFFKEVGDVQGGNILFDFFYIRCWVVGYYGVVG